MSETPIWRPGRERIEASGMRAYQEWLEAEKGLTFADYEAMWRWSVDSLEAFWETIWQYFEVESETPYESVLKERVMPGAEWFAGSRVNYSAPLFAFHRNDPDRPAILSRSELRPLERVSWAELQDRVATLAAALRKAGVVEGDRVAAYLPNIPEAVIAFYACASIGAVWSSCSPDMGQRSVVDRFRQIEPKVLFTVDGYRYGGKDYDRREVVASIRQALPTLETVVHLPYLDSEATLPDTILWESFLGEEAIARPVPMPFDHPLWVVYSSGTTGMPKPIVHSHGGALLESLKSNALHLDLGPADRFMWFSTTGWIMWNAQISALLVGSTICLYEGNPGYPGLETLWTFAEETGMTFFGAGAAYFQTCDKQGFQPRTVADLSTLVSVGSTGSPLPAAGYDWIQREVGEQVLIAAISGGTDPFAAFVGACPILPLYREEMQCRYLGVAAYAVDDDGRKLDDAVGELVVTEPMPSMPIYFWNDSDGARYRESYFETYPGWWRHGDWIRITPSGGAIIYGRSDTTINRHGVRMGTSEIYRVVEGFPEIEDSLVVDLEFLGRESYMPLFIVMKEGARLDEPLTRRVSEAIRRELSGRHVPNEIVPVPAVPRTLTGKKMELPIKKMLLGMGGASVVNADAMANPNSLDFFEAWARERGGAGAGKAGSG